MPNNVFKYEYNDEGLDGTVLGAETFPDIGELKKILDILKK